MAQRDTTPAEAARYLAGLQPEDLKGAPDHELAYCVLVQLAAASAVVANVFRRPSQKAYEPDDFLVRLAPPGPGPTLREAFENVRRWAEGLPGEVKDKLAAADTPAVVDAPPHPA